MELTDRKKRVLRAIVETYINTAEPVGSKAIAQLAGLDVSAATIRNEMADLTGGSPPPQVTVCMSTS